MYFYPILDAIVLVIVVAAAIITFLGILGYKKVDRF
jgi:hypothetical protein